MEDYRQLGLLLMPMILEKMLELIKQSFLRFKKGQ